MNPADYEYLANFLLGSSGLALGTGKEYLLNARLVPLAQSLGLADIGELVELLKNGAEARVTSAVTEAMTTNETSFFRDKVPFQDLKDSVIPNILEARRLTKRLSIWCAAASTGQEPYTISMLLYDSFPELKNWSVEILATDIDTKALAQCEKGIYSQFDVQRGLPVQMLMKYFEQNDDGWNVKDEIRKPIKWKQLNLLNNFSQLGQFDIVFCRNVLIYFEQETKKDILERVNGLVRNDGYLFLGAAETVLGIADGHFERYRECQSAVYSVKAGLPVV